MSINDPIGDLITRIRNAQMRNKSKVSSPGSKLRESVLEVLKTEGYIRGYASVEHTGGARYPRLERAEGKDDVLTDVIKSKGKVEMK